MMNVKHISMLLLIMIMMVAGTLFFQSKHASLPLVAIANFGPHSSLNASIQGMKDELTKHGFVEQQNVRYEVVDVGFDASLIPQMIMNIKRHHPRVLVAITTPVAQYAKGVIHDIPVIYSVITDPVAAGLIKDATHVDGNITGSSDQQDFDVLFDFARQVLNHPVRVGVLYATAESNDLALVQRIKQAARLSHMDVFAVPVHEARDIPMAMNKFNHNVDFIYVGASGVIQPALPVIAAESNKMNIPLFNVNEEAVREHMVLASFGVDYRQVGVNTGKLVVGVLQGKPMASLIPSYPSLKDYRGFISQKNAEALGIHLPEGIRHLHIVR